MLHEIREPRKTHGVCLPCATLFVWRSGQGRALSNAQCRWCRKPLTRLRLDDLPTLRREEDFEPYFVAHPRNRSDESDSD